MKSWLRAGQIPADSAIIAGMPPNGDSREQKTFWAQFATYSQIAFIFPTATVAGWLIGLALDHWLHTTWLYLAGLILGIIAGFVELIRIVTSSEPK